MYVELLPPGAAEGIETLLPTFFKIAEPESTADSVPRFSTLF